MTPHLVNTPDQDTHPSWCDPKHCCHMPSGDLLHLEAPRDWKMDDTRFHSRLVAPVDTCAPDLTTFLELSVVGAAKGHAAWISLGTAQRLYDQLGAHLYRAQAGAR